MSLKSLIQLIILIIIFVIIGGVYFKYFAKEKILVTPTLIKQLPPPLQRIIGDMSNTQKVLLGLDLVSEDKN